MMGRLLQVIGFGWVLVGVGSCLMVGGTLADDPTGLAGLVWTTATFLLFVAPGVVVAGVGSWIVRRHG